MNGHGKCLKMANISSAPLILPSIIVDPQTLKIRAIIDWEYDGFFSEYFEWPFYERPGPSIALDGEHDDSAELLQFMEAS